MILIGLLNVVIGYCSYTQPPEVHERIIPDVPFARGSGSAPPPPAAVACAPAITARVATDIPGGTIVACTPEHVTVQRATHTFELEVSGDQIRSVSEALTLPEIPADVMRAFAVAYPKTIPHGAIRRSVRGGQPIYEVAFPPGAPHTVAVMRPDGSLIELR
jgi:hypothetical protein